MLYDIRCTPEQLTAAAAWAEPSPVGADIELLCDDRMLVVEQGDERTAFDTGGEPGSDEYVSVAPLDRKPYDHLPPKIVESMRAIVAYNWSDEAADFEENREDGPEGEDWHVFQHLQRVSSWMEAIR